MEEEQMIIHLHALLGNRWSAIATHLPMRTDNEIKNYWNTHLKKRLLQIGIDPVTHKPTSDVFLNGPDLKGIASSKLSHMSQWDCARMEAEARLSNSASKFSATHQRSPFKPNDGQMESNPYLRFWQNEVTQNPRPDFGMVEMDGMPQHPVDFQKFLQDWESSLQGQTINNLTNAGSSLHSESSASEVLSVRSTPQRLDSPGVSSLQLHQLSNPMVEPSFTSKIKAEMSPTTTLCSLESQASPCGSSATESFSERQSKFDFPLQGSQSGHAYQEFVLDQVNSNISILSSSSPIPVFPKAEIGDCPKSSFWHDGQHPSLMDSLECGEAEFPASLTASTSSTNFELSQADISPCSSPETNNTASYQACLNSSLLQADFLLELESREPPSLSLPCKFDFHSSSQYAQTCAEIPQFDSLCRLQSASFDTSFSSSTPFGRMHF